MIKYQLLHTRFDQISDHKHDIYLFAKLSSKLLAQPAVKTTLFTFTKTGRLFLNDIHMEELVLY